MQAADAERKAVDANYAIGLVFQDPEIIASVSDQLAGYAFSERAWSEDECLWDNVYWTARCLETAYRFYRLDTLPERGGKGACDLSSSDIVYLLRLHGKPTIARARLKKIRAANIRIRGANLRIAFDTAREKDPGGLCLRLAGEAELEQDRAMHQYNKRRFEDHRHSSVVIIREKKTKSEKSERVDASVHQPAGSAHDPAAIEDDVSVGGGGWEGNNGGGQSDDEGLPLCLTDKKAKRATAWACRNDRLLDNWRQCREPWFLGWLSHQTHHGQRCARYPECDESDETSADEPVVSFFCRECNVYLCRACDRRIHEDSCIVRLMLHYREEVSDAGRSPPAQCDDDSSIRLWCNCTHTDKHYLESRIQIVAMCGVRIVALEYHSCADLGSHLFRHGFFPNTPTRPSTAFAIELMEMWYHGYYGCNLSSTKFMKILEGVLQRSVGIPIPIKDHLYARFTTASHAYPIMRRDCLELAFKFRDTDHIARLPRCPSCSPFKACPRPRLCAVDGCEGMYRSLAAATSSTAMPCFSGSGSLLMSQAFVNSIVKATECKSAPQSQAESAPQSQAVVAATPSTESKIAADHKSTSSVADAAAAVVDADPTTSTSTSEDSGETVVRTSSYVS